MKKLPEVRDMNSLKARLQDESGAILILALLVLVVLAMLGAIASNMSVTDLRSASNERRFTQTFYVAESGWQEVPALLNNQLDVPVPDATTSVVTLTDNTPNLLGGIAYQNVVTELGSRPPAGYGEGYMEFVYQVDTTADSKQGVQVVLEKVYKVGY